MRLEEFVKLVPPPAKPRDNIGDWSEVESALGTTLPTDYKVYIDAYGTGILLDFLWIYNPFAQDVEANLLIQSSGELRTQRELRTKLAIPYPLFPEPGGVLPLGRTHNGDVFFWSTEGEADAWTVVVRGSRRIELEEFKLGLLDMIAALVLQTVTVSAFPDDIPFERQPRFSSSF
jgi:hypothetical protein